MIHTVTAFRYCADRGVKFSHSCHVGGVSTHRNYQSVYIFMRNNESAELKTEINDGTYEQNSSFFLFLCENVTNLAAELNFEVMSS